MDIFDVLKPLAFILFLAGFGGGIVLIRASSLSSDEIWQKYDLRQRYKGLTPERNQEWERSVKISRMAQVFAGVCLLIASMFFLRIFFQVP